MSYGKEVWESNPELLKQMRAMHKAELEYLEAGFVREKEKKRKRKNKKDKAKKGKNQHETI